MGSGVAWVNSKITPTEIPLTTAHELAHSLGFVVGGSPQNLRSSQNHCSDQSCIMYPKNSAISFDISSSLERISTISEGFLESVIDLKSMVGLPSDFCTPCKADMRDLAEVHIGQLRAGRFNSQQVSSRSYIK
jgi:thiol-disulfide isomerase/thioredoxin